MKNVFNGSFFKARFTRNKKNTLQKILLPIPISFVRKIFLKVVYRSEEEEQAKYKGKLIPVRKSGRGRNTPSNTFLMFVPDYIKKGEDCKKKVFKTDKYTDKGALLLRAIRFQRIILQHQVWRTKQFTFRSSKRSTVILCSSHLQI